MTRSTTSAISSSSPASSSDDRPSSPTPREDRAQVAIESVQAHSSDTEEATHHPEKGVVHGSARTFIRNMREAGWLRSVIEIVRFGGNQLKHDRAEQMAAALAFRTIFGLVPVTVIGLLIFHMFGGVERFGTFIHQVLESAHLDTVQLPPAAGSNKPQLLADWLAQLITSIDSNVSFESIGIVGVLLLGWAAIRLMTTIERSFNTVVRAEHNRTLAKRVPLYWTTLTVGPALLYVSFFVNSKFSDMVHNLLNSAGSWSAGLVGFAGVLISLGSTWLFVLLLYMLVPNARVKLRPAAIGAFVSALCWSLGAKAMGGYISSSFGSSSKYGILYGTLGLIPVFLLWVYFMWLMILLGLEITSMCQTYKGRKLSLIAAQLAEVERRREPALFDPDWVIVLMKFVANRFEKGESVRADEIAYSTGLDERAVSKLLELLTRERFLNVVAQPDGVNDEGGSQSTAAAYAGQTSGRGDHDSDDNCDDDQELEEPRYVLSRPAGRIQVSDLLELVHDVARGRQTELADSDESGDSAMKSASGDGWQAIGQLRQSRIQTIGNKTLADI